MADAIITGMATVLGVVLGGWLTYFWTSRIETRKLDAQHQREEDVIIRQNLYAVQDATSMLFEAVSAFMLDHDHDTAGQETVVALDRMRSSIIRVGDPELLKRWNDCTDAWNKAVIFRQSGQNDQFSSQLNIVAGISITAVHDQVQLGLHGPTLAMVSEITQLPQAESEQSPAHCETGRR